jgi:hypothetical protein
MVTSACPAEPAVNSHENENNSNNTVEAATNDRRLRLSRIPNTALAIDAKNRFNDK